MVSRRTLTVTILVFALAVIAVGLQALAVTAEEPADPGLATTVVTLGSIRDTTLYEESDSLSNGEGQYFFAGATSSSLLRRGLLKFDIAGNVPPNALIVSATLRMHVSRHPVGNPQSQPFSVHRVTRQWGEGSSDAGAPGGGGATATEGDATWAFSYFSLVPAQRIAWTDLGGDFLSTASATTNVELSGKSYEWDPSRGMLADLNYWLRLPGKNHGWIVLGNESTNLTARRFNSRENSDVNTRPTLAVEYVAIQHQLYLPLIVDN